MSPCLLIHNPQRLTLLAHARVVLADYDAIIRDFPKLATKTHDEIDRWIIERAVAVSKEQIDQTVVNTPIEPEDGNES